MLKTHSTNLTYTNQKYPSKGPMNSVQSDGIGGCRLTSSFCNYKMFTIFFHRIHYIWSSCSCTWIKTWTKSALSKESHKYTTKKQTVAAMMLATQNPQKKQCHVYPRVRLFLLFGTWKWCVWSGVYVLGMRRALRKAGAKCVTWIPRTASFEALTQHKDQEEFNVSNRWLWLNFRGEEAPYA